jgi:Terminase RNaseH-like domain
VNVKLSDMRRIVVAVDPATTSGDDADETGIIVVAEGPHIEVEGSDINCRVNNCKKHGYVLADRSGRYTPTAWAEVVVEEFNKWKADRIIAEGNQGGEMVESVVRSVFPTAPFKRVTAKQGKRTRAEPIAALYEQGRVHHCGSFPQLEDQLTTWTIDSGESPDRLDALVWGLVELGLTKFAGGREYIEAMATECPSCNALNNKLALVCFKCNADLPQPEPDPEPEVDPEPELQVAPLPFSLTSGVDVQSAQYDAHTQAVMDAIQQFGPQRWSPFRR